MANQQAIDQIARSISFEVEAIPQDNTIQLTSTANTTPLNVKIKVRKKHDAGAAQNAVISIPRLDKPGATPERVRLVSSDQTIMSFNVFMENEEDQKTPRKAKKGFFDFLKSGARSNVDDGNRSKSPTPKNMLGSSSRSTDEMYNDTSLQSANISNNSSHVTRAGRKLGKKGILGKCKPGGCLDPPFGEDRYAYDKKMRVSPVQSMPVTSLYNEDLKIIGESPEMYKKESNSTNVKDSVVDDVTTFNKEVDDTKSFSHTSSQQEENYKVTETYSNSLITYPPAVTVSEQIMYEKVNEKNMKNKTSGAENNYKSSVQSSAEIYYCPSDRKSSTRSNREKNKQDYQTGAATLGKLAISTGDDKLLTTKTATKLEISRSRSSSSALLRLEGQPLFSPRSSNQVTDYVQLSVEGLVIQNSTTPVSDGQKYIGSDGGRQEDYENKRDAAPPISKLSRPDTSSADTTSDLYQSPKTKSLHMISTEIITQSYTTKEVSLKSSTKDIPDWSDIVLSTTIDKDTKRESKVSKFSQFNHTEDETAVIRQMTREKILIGKVSSEKSAINIQILTEHSETKTENPLEKVPSKPSSGYSTETKIDSVDDSSIIPNVTSIGASKKTKGAPSYIPAKCYPTVTSEAATDSDKTLEGPDRELWENKRSRKSYTAGEFSANQSEKRKIGQYDVSKLITNIPNAKTPAISPKISISSHMQPSLSKDVLMKQKNTLSCTAHGHSDVLSQNDGVSITLPEKGKIAVGDDWKTFGSIKKELSLEIGDSQPSKANTVENDMANNTLLDKENLLRSFTKDKHSYSISSEFDSKKHTNIPLDMNISVDSNKPKVPRNFSTVKQSHANISDSAPKLPAAKTLVSSELSANLPYSGDIEANSNKLEAKISSDTNNKMTIPKETSAKLSTNKDMSMKTYRNSYDVNEDNPQKKNDTHKQITSTDKSKLSHKNGSKINGIIEPHAPEVILPHDFAEWKPTVSPITDEFISSEVNTGTDYLIIDRKRDNIGKLSKASTNAKLSGIPKSESPLNEQIAKTSETSQNLSTNDMSVKTSGNSYDINDDKLQKKYDSYKQIVSTDKSKLSHKNDSKKNEIMEPHAPEVILQRDFVERKPTISPITNEFISSEVNVGPDHLVIDRKRDNNKNLSEASANTKLSGITKSESPLNEQISKTPETSEKLSTNKDMLMKTSGNSYDINGDKPQKKYDPYEQIASTDKSKLSHKNDSKIYEIIEPHAPEIILQRDFVECTPTISPIKNEFISIEVNIGADHLVIDRKRDDNKKLSETSASAKLSGITKSESPLNEQTSKTPETSEKLSVNKDMLMKTSGNSYDINGDKPQKKYDPYEQIASTDKSKLSHDNDSKINEIMEPHAPEVILQRDFVERKPTISPIKNEFISSSVNVGADHLVIDRKRDDNKKLSETSASAKLSGITKNESPLNEQTSKTPETSEKLSTNKDMLMKTSGNSYDTNGDKPQKKYDPYEQIASTDKSKLSHDNDSKINEIMEPHAPEVILQRDFVERKPTISPIKNEFISSSVNVGADHLVIDRKRDDNKKLSETSASAKLSGITKSESPLNEQTSKTPETSEKLSTNKDMLMKTSGNSYDTNGDKPQKKYDPYEQIASTDKSKLSHENDSKINEIMEPHAPEVILQRDFVERKPTISPIKNEFISSEVNVGADHLVIDRKRDDNKKLSETSASAKLSGITKSESPLNKQIVKTYINISKLITQDNLAGEQPNEEKSNKSVISNYTKTDANEPISNEIVGDSSVNVEASANIFTKTKVGNVDYHEPTVNELDSNTKIGFSTSSTSNNLFESFSNGKMETVSSQTSLKTPTNYKYTYDKRNEEEEHIIIDVLTEDTRPSNFINSEAPTKTSAEQKVSYIDENVTVSQKLLANTPEVLSNVKSILNNANYENTLNNNISATFATGEISCDTSAKSRSNYFAMRDSFQAGLTNRSSKDEATSASETMSNVHSTKRSLVLPHASAERPPVNTAKNGMAQTVETMPLRALDRQLLSNTDILKCIKPDENDINQSYYKNDINSNTNEKNMTRDFFAKASANSEIPHADDGDINLANDKMTRLPKGNVSTHSINNRSAYAESNSLSYSINKKTHAHAERNLEADLNNSEIKSYEPKTTAKTKTRQESVTKTYTQKFSIADEKISNVERKPPYFEPDSNISGVFMISRRESITEENIARSSDRRSSFYPKINHETENIKKTNASEAISKDATANGPSKALFSSRSWASRNPKPSLKNSESNVNEQPIQVPPVTKTEINDKMLSTRDLSSKTSARSKENLLTTAVTSVPTEVILISDSKESSIKFMVEERLAKLSSESKHTKSRKIDKTSISSETSSKYKLTETKSTLEKRSDEIDIPKDESKAHSKIPRYADARNSIQKKLMGLISSRNSVKGKLSHADADDTKSMPDKLNVTIIGVDNKGLDLTKPSKGSKISYTDVNKLTKNNLTAKVPLSKELFSFDLSIERTLEGENQAQKCESKSTPSLPSREIIDPDSLSSLDDSISSVNKQLVKQHSITLPYTYLESDSKITLKSDIASRSVERNNEGVLPSQDFFLPKSDTLVCDSNAVSIEITVEGNLIKTSGKRSHSESSKTSNNNISSKTSFTSKPNYLTKRELICDNLSNKDDIIRDDLFESSIKCTLSDADTRDSLQKKLIASVSSQTYLERKRSCVDEDTQSIIEKTHLPAEENIVKVSDSSEPITESKIMSNFNNRKLMTNNMAAKMPQSREGLSFDLSVERIMESQSKVQNHRSRSTPSLRSHIIINSEELMQTQRNVNPETNIQDIRPHKDEERNSHSVSENIILNRAKTLDILELNFGTLTDAAYVHPMNLQSQFAIHLDETQYNKDTNQNQSQFMVDRYENLTRSINIDHDFEEFRINDKKNELSLDVSKIMRDQYDTTHQISLEDLSLGNREPHAVIPISDHKEIEQSSPLVKANSVSGSYLSQHPAIKGLSEDYDNVKQSRRLISITRVSGIEETKPYWKYDVKEREPESLEHVLEHDLDVTNNSERLADVNYASDSMLLGPSLDEPNHLINTASSMEEINKQPAAVYGINDQENILNRSFLTPFEDRKNRKDSINFIDTENVNNSSKTNQQNLKSPTLFNEGTSKLPIPLHNTHRDLDQPALSINEEIYELESQIIQGHYTDKNLRNLHQAANETTSSTNKPDDSKRDYEHLEIISVSTRDVLTPTKNTSKRPSTVEIRDLFSKQSTPIQSFKEDTSRYLRKLSGTNMHPPVLEKDNSELFNLSYEGISDDKGHTFTVENKEHISHSNTSINMVQQNNGTEKVIRNDSQAYTAPIEKYDTKPKSIFRRSTTDSYIALKPRRAPSNQESHEGIEIDHPNHSAVSMPNSYNSVLKEQTETFLSNKVQTFNSDSFTTDTEFTAMEQVEQISEILEEEKQNCSLAVAMDHSKELKTSQTPTPASFGSDIFRTDRKETGEHVNESGVVVLDFTFKSYINSKNELVIKTLNSIEPPKCYKDGTISFRSTLRVSDVPVKIPVDSSTNLSLGLSKRDLPLRAPKEEYDMMANISVQPVVEKENFAVGRGQCPMKPANGDYKLQRVLSTVYNSHMIPLQDIIKHLKDDIDALAAEQEIFRQKIMISKKAKAARISHTVKRCGCLRK